MKFVDLRTQYDKIKSEIDASIKEVIDSTAFIHGPQVERFERSLAAFTGSKYVISCANGTDALQIALMSIGLKPGDEVIVPAFTYVATAEVVGLLGLVPVMVDVDRRSFNLSVTGLERALSSRTKAIVPVHLYGQCADMEAILEFARANGLYVVEDNAQAIGAKYHFSSCDAVKRLCPKSAEKSAILSSGTMGDIGCTSFFPSKNLGCFGDGGALFTNNDALAERIRMIANHGQNIKYHHRLIGCNSRLDTLQAAVLEVKLRYLQQYAKARYDAASYYTSGLEAVLSTLSLHDDVMATPFEVPYSTHVYHQYTLRVKSSMREALKSFLAEGGVPTMIYYPLPLQDQEAFRSIARASGSLKISSELSSSVLSLPMHTDLTREQMDLVIGRIGEFLKSEVTRHF
jgi:UDP-2-acetamido-2-deoxy-ribo-hexuluronate aminotransferase